MGVNILTKILDYGIDEKYFQLSTIGKLDKTCCEKLIIEVIDFDKTKNIICMKNGWVTIKSCDALKFVFENKRIDFIEMKSIKNFKRNTDLNNDEAIEEQIESFDFQGKIRDSLNILSVIIQEKKVLTGNERKEFHKIPKRPIFLTDINFEINSDVLIALSLDFLENFSTDITKLLNEEINTVKSDTLNNLQQPILMDCKQFEKYYS